MAATTKTHHVAPGPRGGWIVRKGGSERASKHFATRKDAIQWGKQVSQNQGTTLVIHRKDGTVERKDSQARDPLPDWQARILEERLADLDRNPDDEQTWDEVKAELFSPP